MSSSDAPRPSRRGRLHSRSLDASAALLGALSRGLHSRRPPPTPQPQEPRGRRPHLRARKPTVLHYTSDAAAATAAAATAAATAATSAGAAAEDSESEDDSAARPARETMSRLRQSHQDADRRAARAERQSAKYGVAWRADHESSCCQLCFALFTTLSRRRHHCRLCGALVCGACSQDQALVTGRFSAPRRACDACCGLLRAMAAAGDPRVRLHDGEAAPATPAATSAAASAATPRVAATPTAANAAPTPRYRDRLAEVQRVMAAGHKSRRRGSAEKDMFVVPSAWLRAWLAFTASASTAEARTLDYDDGDRLASSGGPQTAAGGVASVGQAPGPLNTLPLLEMQCGRLVRRAGLVRDEQPQSVAPDRAALDEALADRAADFQLLSPEVWDVFQRLYGGGPAIRVSRAAADPDAWIVDIAGLLALTEPQVARPSVAVERALLVRHRELDASASATALATEPRTPTAAAMTPTASAGTPQSGRAAKTPQSPAWTASSSGCSPLSMSATSDGHEQLARQERGRSSPSPRAEAADKAGSARPAAGVRATVTGLSSHDLEPLLPTTVSRGTVAGPAAADDLRATTTSAARSPTAATAASAFAVAMKQARLNAQKALDDRASRIITA